MESIKYSQSDDYAISGYHQGRLIAMAGMAAAAAGLTRALRVGDSPARTIQAPPDLEHARQRLGLTGKNARARNLAEATGTIDGADIDPAYAISGADSPGTVSANPNSSIQSRPTGTNKGGVPYRRDSDSEFKLLTHFDGILQGRAASGRLRILTERPMCGSCSSVVNQFRQRYPSIDLEIESTGMGRRNGYYDTEELH